MVNSENVGPNLGRGFTTFRLRQPLQTAVAMEGSADLFSVISTGGEIETPRFDVITQMDLQSLLLDDTFAQENSQHRKAVG